MKRTWKTFVLLTVVAVAAFAAVAVASAATALRPAATPNAETAAGAVCPGLGAVDDPEARAELDALRAEKRERWQAWFEKWGADRGSDEAQAELEQLREWYRAEMTALLEKYGIDPSACPGHDNRYGEDGGWMHGGAGCGGGFGGWSGDRFGEGGYGGGGFGGRGAGACGSQGGSSL